MLWLQHFHEFDLDRAEVGHYCSDARSGRYSMGQSGPWSSSVFVEDEGKGGDDDGPWNRLFSQTTSWSPHAELTWMSMLEGGWTRN